MHLNLNGLPLRLNGFPAEPAGSIDPSALFEKRTASDPLIHWSSRLNLLSIDPLFTMAARTCGTCQWSLDLRVAEGLSLTHVQFGREQIRAGVQPREGQEARGFPPKENGCIPFLNNTKDTHTHNIYIYI